ncbi:MAG: amidohydrolase family protein [Rhodothermales bacterium]|nr:amidohydrolase family protein [Rhodothermales bacterium]MBO6780031.1 amidohydrolase family protein [Rhodothermales bacterium]
MKALILVLACSVCGAASAQTTAFINANLLDPATGEVVNGTLVVENGRIAALGDVEVPEGAAVHDLEGRFVLPGYVDAHVHIATVAGMERALASGVTTARSANTPAYQDVTLREMVREGVLPGPEMLATGTFVTPDPGDRILGDARLATLHRGINTDDELRQVVSVNKDRGVDWVKTRGTERAGLPNTDPRKQVYTEAQLRVIVEEAGETPVLVHAHGDEGARAAVLAGARSIEHGTYLSDGTIALMKERGTYLVPTYTIVEDLLLPGGDYDNPVLIIRAQHMLPNLERAIAAAHAAGVSIVTSTDTAYGPESVARVGTEIVNFARIGMSPVEAIRAATTVAAAMLGMEDRIGRIAVGFEADLVVIDGNPLEDVRRVQDVLAVMSNGNLAVNRLPFARGDED